MIGNPAWPNRTTDWAGTDPPKVRSSVALLAPTSTVGEKVISIVQLEADGSVVPQLFVWAKSPTFWPEIEIPLIERPASP